MENRMFVAAMMCLAVFLSPVFASGQEGSQSIDPQAEQVLKQMSDYLKTAQQFSFHAEAAYDQVLESGQKLQQSAVIDVSIRRPDRLHVSRRSHNGIQKFWYNGKTFTLVDQNRKFYAAIDVPDTIDEALDHALEHFAVTAPLSDLGLADPFTALIKEVQTGLYVGKPTIHGTRTHHLAFTQEDMDWQIWIEDGKNLLPRKMVLTYKQTRGAPQFAAVFSNWDLTSPLPDEVFRFSPEEGYERIEFLPAQAGQANQR